MMLLKTAIRIILHEKTKFLGAVAGVALAMFLVLLQWGFYFGYKRDTSVVLDAFDADSGSSPRANDLRRLHVDRRPGLLEGQGPAGGGEGRAGRVGDCAFRHPVNGAAQRVQILGVEFESGIGVQLDAGSDDLASLGAARRLHSRGEKEPAATGGL